MKTVRLRGVRGGAFRTFRDLFDVSFPRNGLFLIRGANQDTGGGSGAGKSNFGLAVAYALGYGWMPATALQSWQAEGKMWAEVLVDDEATWSPVRREPGKLRVGAEPHGAVAHEEERLRTLLGADPKLLGPLVHRRQRERGAFLSLADDEARELLAGPLGLDRLDTESEAAGKRAGTLEKELLVAREGRVRHEGILAGMAVPDLSALTHRADVLSAQLQKADRLVNDAAVVYHAQEAADAERREQEKTVLLAETNLLKSKVAELSVAPLQEVPTSLLAEKLRLEELERGLEARERAATAEEVARRRAHQAARDAVQLRVRSAANADAQLPGARRDLARLQAELAGLQVGNCHTCAKPWPERAENERTTKEAQVAAAANNLSLLEAEALSAGPPTLAAWDIANPPTSTPLQARCAEARTALEGMKQALALELRRVDLMFAEQDAGRREELARLQERLRQLPAQVRELQRPRDGAGTPLGEARAELARRRETQVQAYGDEAAARGALDVGTAAACARAEQAGRVEKAREAEEDLGRRAAAERDLEALLRVFLGRVVEEVLVEVAGEVNRLLAGVANVRHLTFSMRTEKTSKKGTSRTAITPVVGVGPREAVGRAAIRDTLSGGQMAALELAVDLAVLTVVERQVGVRWGWLFLDEVFEGLGPVETETALDMLRQTATDRLVLVVAHNAEVQGLFDSEIVIQHAGGISCVAP